MQTDKPTGYADLIRQLRNPDLMVGMETRQNAADALEAAERVIRVVNNHSPNSIAAKMVADWLAQHATAQRKGGGDWVRERVRRLQWELRSAVHDDIPLTTALKDAVEHSEQRTREEERANAAKALKLAKEIQDKAVAAERERHLPVQQMCLKVGRDSILSQLRNPDEALVEILAPRICRYRWSDLNDRQKASWREDAKSLIRALASLLTEREEGDDG